MITRIINEYKIANVKDINKITNKHSQHFSQLHIFSSNLQTKKRTKVIKIDCEVQQIAGTSCISGHNFRSNKHFMLGPPPTCWAWFLMFKHAENKACRQLYRLTKTHYCEIQPVINLPHINKHAQRRWLEYHFKVFSMTSLLKNQTVTNSV